MDKQTENSLVQTLLNDKTVSERAKAYESYMLAHIRDSDTKATQHEDYAIIIPLVEGITQAEKNIKINPGDATGNKLISDVLNHINGEVSQKLHIPEPSPISGNTSETVLEGQDVTKIDNEARHSPRTLHMSEGKPIPLEQLRNIDLIGIPDDFAEGFYRVNHSALDKYLAKDKVLAQRSRETAPLELSSAPDVERGVSASDGSTVYASVSELATVSSQCLDTVNAHERAHIHLKHSEKAVADEEWLQKHPLLAPALKLWTDLKQRGYEREADLLGSDYVDGGAEHFAGCLNELDKVFVADPNDTTHGGMQGRIAIVQQHGKWIVSTGVTPHQDETIASNASVPNNKAQLAVKTLKK